MGLLTGLLLFFPGVPIIKGVTWALSSEIGNMTIEETLLAIVVILLATHIVRQTDSPRSAAVKTVYGLLLGIALFYPGTVVVRWLVVDVLGLLSRMSTSEALLAIIVITLSVFIWQTPSRSSTRLREVRGGRG